MKTTKKKPQSITCSVVLDYMGSYDSDPEEEFEKLQKDLRRVIANPVSFEESKMVHRINPKSDLVLFDFGGLMPGNNLMQDQSRALIQWAQDHPSALVLVVSKFTFTHGIQPEMEDMGLGELHNVKLWWAADPFPEWPGITPKEQP